MRFGCSFAQGWADGTEDVGRSDALIGGRGWNGTAKRSYGLRRMRWLGLAKAGLQFRLTAIAYNLRRSWRLLAAVPA